MDITAQTVRSLRKALDSREIGAVELCRAYLDRIERLDGRLKSYITVTADKALKMADEAQKRIDSGNAAALTGIPAAIKDNICTKGVRTTCSSRMLESFVPPYDATVVERLTDSGCVMLGKTSLDEFAMGGSNQTSAFARTVNPYDTDRVPGGSSG
ncbi:MAG: Asp-tRNA(Asn)/Glu-tRNA(Gln) amidotransferase subunit GatA, partial [Oscillospiraceae bacterium]|nr:Asp-tRNA(Asn)/Glu-tRNA(Gln) amidotransferase subunit GatA [Oscillospiraceae bacterium]